MDTTHGYHTGNLHLLAYILWAVLPGSASSKKLVIHSPLVQPVSLLTFTSPPLPPCVQVKTGILRSEHQKNACRIIKDTVETEIHKRSKERDKDKEKLQSQLASVSVEQLSEAESISGGGPSVVSGTVHDVQCTSTLYQ